jgi:hypothetical protein
MARKRYRAKEIVDKPREVDVAMGIRHVWPLDAE